MNKLLFIDTETTGLDPAKNGIIQIAGIIEIDGLVVEKFNFTAKPFDTDEINDEALSVCGISRDDIQKLEPATSFYSKLSDLFSKYVDKYDRTDKFFVVGYNVEFDVNMLRAYWLKMNDKYFGSWVSGHKIDLQPVVTFLTCVGKIPNLGNMKLETIANHFGITINAHDAMSDIEATRDLFHKLKI